MRSLVHPIGVEPTLTGLRILLRDGRKKAECKENRPDPRPLRDELPKTMVGKVLSRILVEEEKEKAGQETGAS